MRHLLGLEDLSAADITALLDAAAGYVGVGVGDVTTGAGEKTGRAGEAASG